MPQERTVQASATAAVDDTTDTLARDLRSALRTERTTVATARERARLRGCAFTTWTVIMPGLALAVRRAAGRFAGLFPTASLLQDPVRQRQGDAGEHHLRPERRKIARDQRPVDIREQRASTLPLDDQPDTFPSCSATNVTSPSISLTT